ncbi:MAG: 50S ribosomal protein L24 [Candidatus Aenigmatarchaeota archaeon]
MKRPKSKKPRKQRKFIYNAPWHLRRKMMSATLSKELREQLKRRSLPVRKGDEVEIMRGEFRKVRGKVIKCDYKNYRIYVENIKKKKSTGAEYLVPIHPSKVKIINLNLSDKKRLWLES